MLLCAAAPTGAQLFMQTHQGTRVSFMAKLKGYFLNVGQGDSTYLEFTDSKGKTWRILIDCNLDKREKRPGIDVIKFLSDQMPSQNGKKVLHLDYLIVTHPHADHIRGLAAIGNDYTIGEMWDSGHTPEPEMAKSDLYKKYVKVKEKHKDVLHIDDRKWSRTPVSMCGDELQAHILRPSKYVEADTGDAVHAECMCFKLIFNDFCILFTGDSNRAAWEAITAYKPFKDDADTFNSQILHASHHGSRTFFKKDEDDEPFLDGIKRIDPDHLIISVPPDSVHHHPHKDAMEIYEDYVPEDETYLTHENTVLLEVDEKGTYTLDYDDGGIQDEYELGPDDDDDPDGDSDDDQGNGGSGGSKKSRESRPPAVIRKSRSTLDDQGAA
jgi:competence protein ComEC